MAARRVAKQMGLQVRHVVADARYLPFRSEVFDVVFSYSVLQHFSKDNVATALDDISVVLKPGATALIQMPNAFGIRSFQHLLRRGFREARNFEVRYWSLSELKRLFRRKVGPTSVTVDCYFGLGLQKSDIELMSPVIRVAITISEFLRKLSLHLPFLKYVADSVYVRATREARAAAGA
jgi:SAM-dependent methyltransferase